ncbi:SAM-dependent methyltransferase [Streptomyces ovatisporus]|uniref:SAM-dependent methyltransferase n=1 Tax=Streptomyces ovatisporus TaxID=1128682 RepID=A0ABV9ACA9_9ACTN
MNEPENRSHPGGGRSDDRWTTWRAAAERALYGADGEPEGGGRATVGFFVRERPGSHFRTSVHASPLFAEAVARLLLYVDEALARPAELTLVDVGAGAGELLAGVLAALPAEAAGRVRPYAVERAPRPEGLDERIVWTPELPTGAGLVGLLFANEWLDNVPVDVVETAPDGVPHTVLVRPADGAERLGGPLGEGPDADWLTDWWPLGPEDPPATGAPRPGAAARPGAGLRAEIGRPRDEAWAAAVRTLDRGLAVAVDYAHSRDDRPPFGTLTGYLDGRETRPVPDGGRDLTAHVALDACAAAGALAAEEKQPGGRGNGDGGRTDGTGAASPALLSQRDALRALGVRGTRPPLKLASTEPAEYVRRLAAAGEAAELTDPAGLGAFSWLVQPLGGVSSPFG